MKPLSILQMNTAAGFGGGERVLVDLASGLLKRGHRVGAVVRDCSPLLDQLLLTDVEIAMRRRHGGLGLLSAHQLARVMDRGGWEIVCAHRPPDCFVASLAKRLSSSKPKLVFTRHILLPMRTSPLHRLVFAQVDAFVGVSDAVRETLAAHTLIDEKKVRTIRNGIDVEKFTPNGSRSLRKRLNVGVGEYLVGILGEVSPHKGQEDFIRAAIMLLECGYEAKFVIAGPTKPKNTPYLDHITRMARDFDRTSQIHFVGNVTDVPDAMRSLDVMVLASEAEPFGLVTVEAMACGCAVVATRSGASAEIITDGWDGVLVEPAWPEGIRYALSHLMKDEVFRKGLCECARQTAVQKFNQERNFEEVESLYAELVG